MKRLVFIVEGDSEIIFINKLVIPHLLSLGFKHAMHTQTIITNRKQHKKGGVGSFGKFENEIKRTLAQGNVIVTTFIDFFRIPGDFPEYSQDSSKIDKIEKAIESQIEHEGFIAYIQKHEFEALYFSDPEAFEIILDDPSQKEKIKAITQQYPNPEDINNSPQTAPSKRLDLILGKYEKVFHGDFIVDGLSMDIILHKCPRFNSWIQRIIEKLGQ